MDFNRLPNEIIREIVGALDPNVFVDMFTLQQLRLANHRLNVPATFFLFRDFQIFSVGDVFEDIRGRIRTLRESELRGRVNGLKVPSTALTPRFVLKQALIESSYQRIFPLLWKEFCSAVTELVEILGPDFRFESVEIGGCPDVCSLDWENYDRRYQAVRARLFSNLARELLVSSKAFSRVKKLTITVLPTDFLYFLGIKDGDWPGWPWYNFPSIISLDMASWLARIEHFVFKLPMSGGLERSELEAAGYIARRFKPNSMSFQYYGFRFYPWQGVGDERVAPSIELLELNQCLLLSTVDLFDALKVFPNLVVLQLREVNLPSAYDGHLWSAIFPAILDKCPALATVFMEGLGYSNPVHMAHSVFGYTPGADDILNAADGRTYKRPLISCHDDDIRAFLRFRSDLESRRTNRRLKEDSWLSVFCLTEEVDYVIEQDLIEGRRYRKLR